MKDAELTMLLYPYGDHDYTWNVTCVYSSIELARKFYKDMIQARMSVVTAENSELVSANAYMSTYTAYWTCNCRGESIFVVIIP